MGGWRFIQLPPLKFWIDIMQKPLVDNKYILEKFQGKGGWTYACIPEM